MTMTQTGGAVNCWVVLSLNSFRPWPLYQLFDQAPRKLDRFDLSRELLIQYYPPIFLLSAVLSLLRCSLLSYLPKFVLFHLPSNRAPRKRWRADDLSR